MRKVLILAAAAVCVATAGVAGIFASGSEDVRHTIREKPVVDKSTLAAEEAKPEVIKPMGDPFPPVAESTVPMQNDTPTALIAGTLDARARGDNAWLARTLESTTKVSGLTVEHTNIAWRQFTSRSITPLWDKLEAAWKAGEYTISEDGDKATITFKVGGNLDTVPIAMIRIGGKWYHAGS